MDEEWHRKQHDLAEFAKAEVLITTTLKALC